MAPPDSVSSLGFPKRFPGEDVEEVWEEWGGGFRLVSGGLEDNEPEPDDDDAIAVAGERELDLVEVMEGRKVQAGGKGADDNVDDSAPLEWSDEYDQKLEALSRVDWRLGSALAMLRLRKQLADPNLRKYAVAHRHRLQLSEKLVWAAWQAGRNDPDVARLLERDIIKPVVNGLIGRDEPAPNGPTISRRTELRQDLAERALTHLLMTVLPRHYTVLYGSVDAYLKTCADKACRGWLKEENAKQKKAAVSWTGHDAVFVDFTEQQRPVPVSADGSDDEAVGDVFVLDLEEHPEAGNDQDPTVLMAAGLGEATWKRLTRRQRRIRDFKNKGFTDEAIQKETGISLRTIEREQARIRACKQQVAADGGILFLRPDSEGFEAPRGTALCPTCGAYAMLEPGAVRCPTCGHVTFVRSILPSEHPANVVRDEALDFKSLQRQRALDQSFTSLNGTGVALMRYLVWYGGGEWRSVTAGDSLGGRPGAGGGKKTPPRGTRLDTSGGF